MKKMIKIFTAFVVILASFLTATPIQAADPIKVKTTFYPVYFLAKEIAGDKADVSMLLDGGEDAHSYEISARDTGEVQEADLFIYLDDEMEFFVADLLSLINTDNTKVLKTTEGIKLLAGDGHGHDHDDEDDHGHHHDDEDDHGHHHDDEDDHGHHHDDEDDHGHHHDDEDDHHHDDEDDHGHGHDHGHAGHTHEFDPHTWLDPKVYAKQAENVRDALIEIDPDNTDTYTKNAATLIENLNKLDQEYAEGLKDLKERRIVVQHAAFGYLAHAYNLEQIAIAGLSTTQEPGAEKLGKMQKFVKENNIKVIYVDPLTNQAISQTVASSTGAELLPLTTLEVVSKDEDYFTLMRQNLEQLKKN